jgi:hypothetical protein
LAAGPLPTDGDQRNSFDPQAANMPMVGKRMKEDDATAVFQAMHVN